MNIGDMMRKDLSGISDTVHGGQAWRLKGVEDFSHNLNPLGPPECLKDIIAEAVSGLDNYPDDRSSELKDALSRHFNIGPCNIIAGAGSSDIIRMFPNTFLERGDKALIMRPSFAEYAHQCRIAGASVHELDLKEDNGLRIDTGELLENAKNVKAIYICNPNNPTGRIEGKEKILGIVKECSDRGILVFLDETLLELVPSHKEISCAGHVKNHDNLVVTGSFTKSFAIPGIRIGFGLSNENIIKAMDKVRMTWNVGRIEQHVAASLIKSHMDHVAKAADMMHSEAKYMHKELNRSDFEPDMTDSFFFFSSVAKTGMNASEFTSRMLLDKIAVRDCSSFGKEFEGHIRFCVKDRPRNDMFIDSVRKITEGR